ncbi:hypothetical protein TI04_09665 [Achromatium sp. WMS2]|nr:hypothetical protein TI04_09665 [Achromatium sp. WMS2]
MKKLSIVSLLCLFVYLFWPYLELWRLEQAALKDDDMAVASFIDLKAIQVGIKRRLNKDFSESNTKMSDEFVIWIQDGIQRLGTKAVEELVDLRWVKQQLLTKNIVSKGGGFLRHIGYAAFTSPNKFLVRIGDVNSNPVYLHFVLSFRGWLLSAIYN